MADYYEDLVKVINAPATAKDGANWMLGGVSTILNEETIDIKQFAEKIGVDALAGLISQVANKVVTANTGKEVLNEMFKTGKSAKAIIEEKGLAQISDEGALDQAIDDAIKANPQAVADFKAGKTQSVRFLVGQVMKLTKGRANPNLVTDMINKKLGEL
jgi:aspartyl-tRNA(Asn)/glutamyl-tRNA(Gln) amidotransferase subunit B